MKSTHDRDATDAGAASRPPDLGLPPEAYVDPTVYAAEKERLFRDGWMCVGRVDQIPAVGDYLTVDLEDEPLVVVRDRRDVIRVLSRVCRHRSADLIPGEAQMARGHASAFVCPYHAWSYRLDGRLAAAPLMNERLQADGSDCRLPEHRSAIWQGWIFVNLSGSAPEFADGLEDLDRFLAPYRLKESVVVASRDFDSPWNWKVLVDNFMEAYHHVATHRASLQPTFPAADAFVPESTGPFSLLVMPASGSVALPPGPLPRRSLPAKLSGALVAGVVYPFHLFAVSSDVLTWYQLFPIAADRFGLRVYVCVDSESAEDEALAPAIEAQLELTAHVHTEDIAACDAVWAGLKSRDAVAGPLAPQERALSEFCGWWRNAMDGD